MFPKVTLIHLKPPGEFDAVTKAKPDGHGVHVKDAEAEADTVDVFGCEFDADADIVCDCNAETVFVCDCDIVVVGEILCDGVSEEVSLDIAVTDGVMDEEEI